LNNTFSDIELKLRQFKVRSLRIRLLKGLLIWLSLFSSLFIITGITEWLGEMSSFNRTIVVSIFLFVSIISAAIFIFKPLVEILRVNNAITNNSAAKTIGNFFPVIGDKLLNYLELSNQTSKQQNALTEASLRQRAHTFAGIEFSEAVDVQSTKKPVRVFIPLLVIIGLLLVLSPKDFIASTDRIIHFRKEYIPQAPFQFEMTSELNAYQNEDYLLIVQLKGNSIPQELFVVEGKSKVKMAGVNSSEFSLTYPKIQQTKSFHFEAAGFRSSDFKINILARPSMNLLTGYVRYPKYLQRSNEVIKPVGELDLPEGSMVKWELITQHTDSAIFFYNSDSTVSSKINNNRFLVERRIIESGYYGFKLASANATQKGKIEYEINSIKDEYPSINIQSFTDTLLYKSISIGGDISDDYGISNLILVYQIGNQRKQQIILPFNKSTTGQNIYTNWNLDSIAINPGEELSYYLQVFDNDGVNGFKSTKTKQMYMKVPSKEELNNQLTKAENTEKSNIKNAHKKAEELRKKLDKTLENINGKKELHWEDKQNIKELLKEKEKLNEKIEELKRQNELLQMQRNDLQQPSPGLEKKAEQLQRLMNELLDEETKQLYDELQKLLEEQAQADDVQSLLNEIQNNEINLEEELERTLELFKRLQVEQNLEKLTEDLNQLAEDQENLADETKEKQNSAEDLKINQEEIEKQFDQIKESLEDTKDQNNELKRPESFEDTSGDEKDIKKEISESKENLDKNNRKKSSQNQKQSSDKMKSLAKKLDNMQGAMQMEQMQEDIGNLRAILENLITLSYNQEKVMVEFGVVNQSDPQFVSLSEEQLKIQDDSQIIKDSLLSLATRVMSISSFVTRELNEMDTQLNKSSEAIKDRKKPEASGYQQLSMTSMNNLALMLDNVLQQMQESMADASGKGKGDKKQPMPGMSELQEQLNKEIRELQQSGKTGKELSQELAKLAAQQEMIRKALRDAEEKLGNKPSGKEGEKPGNLGNLQKQMEQTELDLVNKNLSRDLQRRQQQIMSRLLEAEKALREQELDLKRESNSAVQYEKELPRAFEDYLKQKQKEIELIKTIPPKLHPYYKKEVNEYFNRLNNRDN